jgi:type II pantothenate kinase
MELLGIDAGGSLIKIVHASSNSFLYKRTISIKEIDKFIDLVIKHPKESTLICLTGGRCKVIESLLESLGFTNTYCYDEFNSNILGADYKLNLQNKKIEAFILTSIGTGTSINIKTPYSTARLGGTPIGGGFLFGFSKLIANIETYDEIINTIDDGDGSKINLTVGDIYKMNKSPIPEKATASYLGGVDKEHSLADILDSGLHVVGDTVARLSSLYASLNKIQDVVYVGSTLTNNNKLAKIISSINSSYKINAHFFNEDSSFIGAIGAILQLKEGRELLEHRWKKSNYNVY